MSVGYLLIAVGLAIIWFVRSAIRSTRKYGFTVKRSGKRVPPTDQRSIKNYTYAMYAHCVIAASVVVLGIWLAISPETFLSLLPK
jgi:hypothetical protein